MKMHNASALLLALVAGLGACVSEESETGGKSSGSTASRPTSKPSGEASKGAAERSAEVPRFENVDAAGAKKLIAENAAVVVLDVRTAAEYAEGHLEGAVNIDFRAADFADKLQELDKTKTYLVHCKSGGRSTNSLEDFKKLGFAHVVHLDGGMNAWNKAGNPTVK